MNHVPVIREKLRIIHDKTQNSSLYDQDAEITALQRYLSKISWTLLPSYLYPCLQKPFEHYLSHILPQLSGMSKEAQKDVSAKFEQAILCLNTQEQTAKDLETKLSKLFWQVRTGTLPSANDMLIALCKIIVCQEAELPEVEHLIEWDNTLEECCRTLKTAFTSTRVLSFFEQLTSACLPHPIEERFERIKELFWHQVQALIQLNAVMVNTYTQEARIMRFDINTSLHPMGLDELEFEHKKIDDKMFNSCWKALRVVRMFLKEHFPEYIEEQGIRVRCCFENPLGAYVDSSASLLLAVKVIGDMLDLEFDPHTIISGEIYDDGEILPVQHTAEKIKAAEQNPTIQHIMLPLNGQSAKSTRLKITRVPTFSEALQEYYGDRLKSKEQGIIRLTRRQVMGKIVRVFAVVAGLPVFKNIFAHPVTEQDRWSIDHAKELYQKQSNYQEALRILYFMSNKLSHGMATPEVLLYTAQVSRHLGMIYMQQYKTRESIAHLQKALHLCQAIHDREQQCQIFLNMSSVYYNSLVVDGNTNHGIISLQYMEQANDLLHPAMKTFQQLQGDYYGHVGGVLYGLEEYETAKERMQRCLDSLDEHDVRWTYYLSKQFLGRILTRLGEFDEAGEILGNTLWIPVLQRPYNQVRNLRSLSELSFLTGAYDKGVYYACESEKLCQEYGLKTQHIALQKMLFKHHIPLSVIRSGVQCK